MNSFSFLTIGKTQESTEASEGFKRYIGVGSSHVIAVNPTKAELEKIYGREMSEPEYVVDTEDGKEARITFIVKTDPEQCNGIEIINRAMFTLRNAPAYTKDKSKVQVIDSYGNTARIDTEDAKAGKAVVTANGNPARIDTKYRMACVGEADLVAFLKAYLGIGSVFDYVNGTWTKKKNAEDFLFTLEHIKDYFKGDVSELKEALALQPNNKVKLLYGVRTTDDNKQYQSICTREGMVLRNNAGAKAYDKLEKELVNAKQSGMWSNIEYKVQDLQEYVVEPTNLSTADDSSESTSEMPWD